MPIHDWSRVESGLFHHFHQAWTIELSAALNAGILPPDFFALADQVVGGPIPDVVALQRRDFRPERSAGKTGGVATVPTRPRARFITKADIDVYAGRANRIVIKYGLGQVVAVIEIVSPGNKSTSPALRAFATKAAELLRQRISLLVVDLFPPSQRDPQGIHKAIWDEVLEEPFSLPSDKPLTVVAYDATAEKTAYVEPVAVGDALPELPIFLAWEQYVMAPLEASYQATWDKCPQVLRDFVASGGQRASSDGE